MTLSLMFGVWPYLAGLILLAGIALRCWLSSTRFDKSRFDKSRLNKPRFDKPPLDKPRLDKLDRRLAEAATQLAGGRLRRTALVALMLGHLVAVTLPHQLLTWSHGAPFLFLWESVVFAAAGIVLAGMARQVWRQLADAAGSRLTQSADTVFLTLLLAGSLSGLLMAVLHRWAAVWGVLLLTPYVHSVIAGHPSVEQLAQVPFLARIHLFSMISLLAVFPFSRFAILAIGPLQSGAAMLLRFLAAVWTPCRRTFELGVRWASLTLGLSVEEE